MEEKMKVQQEGIKELLRLVQENPELRIVPMVDTECVYDDSFSYWMADWGKAEIDEIWMNEECVYSKSNNFDTLVDELMFNESLTEEEARNKVNSYDWEKVITVCIKPIG